MGDSPRTLGLSWRRPRGRSAGHETIADYGMNSMARGPNLRAWLTMAALLAIAGAGARADDLYTVSGIAVDRTAASPQAARDAAITEAEQKAFAILMRRLTDPAQAARVPQPSGQTLADLVQGFQVENERASA